MEGEKTGKQEAEIKVTATQNLGGSAKTEKTPGPSPVETATRAETQRQDDLATAQKEADILRASLGGVSSKESPAQPKTENPGESDPKPKKEFNPNYQSSDPFEILGVKKDATTEEVLRAYRVASKETHPNFHRENAEETKKWTEIQAKVNEAFRYAGATPEERIKMDEIAAKDRRVREAGQKRATAWEESKNAQASPKAPRTENRGESATRTGKEAKPGAPKTEPKKGESFTEKVSRKAKETAERVSKATKRGANAASKAWKAERVATSEAKIEKIRQQAEIVRKARAEEKEAHKKDQERLRKEAEAEKQRKTEETKKEKEAKLKVGLEGGKEKLKKAWAREQAQREAENKSETGKPEEEKEVSAEKKEASPWEKYGENPKVSAKYFEATRLTPESKKSINESLHNEIGDIKTGLAQKWFEQNKYKFEAKGIVINGLSQEAMARFAMDPATGELSKEAGDYFKANKDLYGADLLKIENAKALGTEFGKENVAPESQFLMLNHLENRARDLSGQIENLEKLGGPENRNKADMLRKEADSLFIARKELAEKATGRNLDKETAERVYEGLGYGSKEEYMQDKALISQTELAVKVKKMNALEEREFAGLSPKERAQYTDINDFVKNWENKGKMKRPFFSFSSIYKGSFWGQSSALSQDQFYALTDAGYHAKEGFFAKYLGGLGFKAKLVGQDGKVFKMHFRDIKKYATECEKRYNKDISASAGVELGRRWDQEKTGAIIKEMTVTMEQSVGGTESAYERLKNNLIEEYKNDSIKEKTPKEQAKQDKEFGKKGDINLSDLLNGEGIFSTLTGDLKQDKKALAGIFRDADFDASPRAFRSFDTGSYENAVKNKKDGGLLTWFIRLMIQKSEQNLRQAI